MNPTELKTLRQSLFLSKQEAAALHGVQERVYRYWEAGDWAIPADVAARMAMLDDAADKVAHAAVQMLLDHDLAPVLIRYAKPADLWEMTPPALLFIGHDLELQLSAHAAGIDRARQDIKRNNGQTARIVTMDRAAYDAWLQDHEWYDEPGTRQLWAATVIDPPTRAKKTIQASGEQKSVPTSGEQNPPSERHSHGR